MKVLLVNGSPHEFGCTHRALAEIQNTLREENVDSEILWLGREPLGGCIACGGCRHNDRCIYDDILNKSREKFREADGFVFGSPVYYAHPSGRLLSVLDRLFFSGNAAFKGKPGAAVVSARRAGTTASIDVINKYFSIAQMPIVGSSYWNMVHGANAQEVYQDEEGMRTMRVLAHNMAYFLRCQEAGRAAGVPLPRAEEPKRTNFIR